MWTLLFLVYHFFLDIINNLYKNNNNLFVKMSDDADYNKFLNKLSNNRRQVADSNSRAAQSSSFHTSVSQATTLEDMRPMKSIIVGRGQPIIVPGERSISQSLNGNASSSCFSAGSKKH